MEKLQNLKASIVGGEKIGTIDLNDPKLLVAAAAIAFNPTFWK